MHPSTFLSNRSKYLPLYIFFGAMIISLVTGKEAILREDNCWKFHLATSKSRVNWANSKSDQSCYICNYEDTRKSWFYIKYVRYQDVKLIHADITFRLTNCTECKNQYLLVNALYNESLTMKKSRTEEDLDYSVFLKNLTVSKLGEREVHHIAFRTPEDSNGVSLVFISEGGCIVVYNISLKYYYCERTYKNAMRLPITSAPAQGNFRVNGTCAENSVSNNEEPVYGLCSSNGTWFVSSRCLCNKGYSSTQQGCQACKRGFYKDKVDNSGCYKCPENSQSRVASLECQCNDGYYRLIGENHRHACYGIPSKIEDIEFPRKTESSIEMKWNKPSKRINAGVFVNVECFICDNKHCSTPCKNEKYVPSKYNISGNNVTITNLKPNKKYKFVLITKNGYRINDTFWSRTTKLVDTKGGVTDTHSDLPMAIIIAVPIVVIILILIICVLIYLLRKRKLGRRFTMLRRAPRNRGRDGALPLIEGEKNYIDPTTYGDPERAVSEFAKELNRDQLEFVSVIGGGEFGDVYKGIMRRSGELATDVAIKTLKPGSTNKNRKDFLLEASIMGQFKNLNVIALEGVVTKSVPLLIVTEFMEKGSLDEYLKRNDGVLKPLQLLGMARGVANGMAYLAGMHFVHRDLAARNVLVNVNLACKVADFGLSRDVGETPESEYETQGGKIAVRWTAPEAIHFRKFSSASDVWSYGILLWEMMSFAERPYWDWANLVVIERVESGYRLPPPMNCPKTVHQLMIECWAAERTERPSFTEIVRILDEWIRSPEKLNEEHVKVKKGDPLDFTTFKTVKDWLDAFKMGMYASNFTKAGYRNLDDVSQLSENELLSKVGVTLVGHRHKIYQQIKELNKHLKLARDDSVRI